MTVWSDLEYNELLRAIEQNDLTAVSNLIYKYGKFNHFNDVSLFPPPLLLALDWRGKECVIPPENVALVQMLIDAGAEVNVRNATSETPLIIAAWTGKYNTTSLLLEAKADVNDSTDYGYTSLITAAQYGYNDIVTSLLLHGANVNMQTAEGLTALMRAASGGYTKTVRILIAHGADINIITKRGDTALTLAREARHYKLARLILSLSS